MAAEYPANIKTFTTKDPGDPIQSAHINELQDEVVAVETQLVTSKLATLTTAPAANNVLTTDGSGVPTWREIADAVYPVGAIYMSVSSTNPGTLFGGTWIAWGTGKVPVGIDTGDTDFDTVEETGGAKTHTNPLSDNGAAKIGTVGGVTAHIHRSTLTQTWNSSHAVVGTAGGTTALTYGAGLFGYTDSGSSLQPYIVCYMWKRTA